MERSAPPDLSRWSTQVKRKAANPKPRSQIEARLKQFEAMNPTKLNSEERKFRSLAIRALKIELEPRAKGLIDDEG